MDILILRIRYHAHLALRDYKMLENIRDRGNKKWTSLFLPEHVEQLKGWIAEDDYNARPQLDEFELTLIAEEIERAYKGKMSIKLTHWIDGNLIDDFGKIITIDNSNKSIVLDDPFTTTRYKFDDIVAISIID